MPPQNQGLPSNPPSLGGFVGNLGQDISGLVQGVVGLPGTLLNLVKQPSQIPQFVGGLAQGAVEEAKRVLPVKGVQVGGITLPSLDPMKPVKAFYDKPVSTTLDALALAQAAGVPKTPKGGTTLEDTGNALLRSQYKLTPSQARATNLGESVSKLANYGITNADDVRNIVPQVTGENGILSKVVNEAISKSSPIDVSGLDQVAKDMIEAEPLITETAGNKLLNVVNKGIFGSAVKAPGAEIGGLDAAKTFDFVQALESKAATLASGTDEAQALSRVFRGVSDELKNRLFTSADQVPVQDVVANYIDKIREINPQLADEVLSSQTIGNLRSLQAPFVRMGKALGISDSVLDNAILSSKDLGAGLIGSIVGGGPGGAATMLAEKALGTNVVKSALGGAVRGLGGIGSTIGKVAKGLGLASPVLSTAGGNVPPSNQTGYNQQAQKSNQGTSSVTGVTSKYQAPSLPQGFLTGDQYNTQVNDLTQQIANSQASGDRVTATRLQGQLDQIKNSWNSQQPIRDQWTKTNIVSGVASSAYNLIKRADPSLLNLSASIDSLFKAGTSEYAALQTAIQYFAKESGLDLSKVKTEGALLSALDTAVQDQNNNYNAFVQQFFGGALPNPTTGQVTPSTPVQPIQQQGLPSVPSAVNFGRAGVGAPQGPIPNQ